jgi:VanZ family protein
MKHHVPTLLQASLILFLCGIPGRDIPHISFLEMLSFDKFVHASVFFLLTLFAIRGCLLSPKLFFQKHAKLLSVSSAIVYGGLMEVMQATCFEERSADWYDFIANSFGCFMALFFYNKLARLLTRFNFPLHA